MRGLGLALFVIVQANVCLAVAPPDGWPLSINLALGSPASSEFGSYVAVPFTDSGSYSYEAWSPAANADGASMLTVNGSPGESGVDWEFIYRTGYDSGIDDFSDAQVVDTSSAVPDSGFIRFDGSGAFPGVPEPSGVAAGAFFFGPANAALSVAGDYVPSLIVVALVVLTGIVVWRVVKRSPSKFAGVKAYDANEEWGNRGRRYRGNSFVGRVAFDTELYGNEVKSYRRKFERRRR